MKNQKITLRSEDGSTETRTFTDIHEAAKWCLGFLDHGITLEVDNNNETFFDEVEWQETLEFYFK